MSFYLTTPIYYVNSTPHIGHAYTTIAADILVRHHRQRGEETFFLTGTDEHASKNVRAAEAQGLDPQAFVDRMAGEWRALAERVNASNDFFIRTTDADHKEFVQDFLRRVYENGDIYQDVYSGLYCVGCEDFKTAEDLVDGLCPEHGTAPEYIEERNYFFRLSAYQERLLRLYDERPDFVRPQFRYNEARSFIERGLRDFSVSRADQAWGVRIPWDPDQVVYVWVDALINYLSALTYAREGENLIPRFWPDAHHLLGKDILRFHCVYWPALLLAAGYDVPRQLFVHGYLLIDERKISKSVGKVIDPLDLVDVYGVDPVRFYVSRVARFGQDGTASVDGFHERYESELANELGNLLSRTTSMIARYREGRLAVAPGESQVARVITTLGATVAERFDGFDLTGALEAIWELVRALNRHVEQTKPWELARDPALAENLDRVLFDLADGLRAAAVALSPFVPETAGRILGALGQADDLSWQQVEYGLTRGADAIEPAAPLFPRVDLPAAAA